MDVRCRIEMLGMFRVVQGEQTHTRFRTHKAASLLAYLALHLQQAHPRERLLDLLWPDMEPQAARDNLSTTLTQLRRQLEPPGVAAGSLLITTKQHVRLNPDAVRTDVAEFYDLLRQARQSNAEASKAGAGEDEAALLEQALARYKGPLLPGWYEEWVTPEQTRCQAAHLDALRELTRHGEMVGRYTDALAWAQQVTRADPYDESGWQAQMRLLVRLRKPSAALQVYDTLDALFRQELGARPSASSRQMAETIRSDPRAALLLKVEAAAALRPPQHTDTAGASAVVSPQAAPASAVPASAAPAPACVPAAPPLPLQLTRFFGRAQECAQLALLLQTPDTRLVSVLGPGGAGKTRLSLEVAGQVAGAFANRVWFVPLADIPDAALIVSTLAHTLRLPLDAQGDPLEGVIAHLGDAPCLLVLDNLEHLLRDIPGAGKNDNPAMSGAVGLIRLLLSRASGLVCLVTSRTALRLGGEHVYPLPPLALPADADTGSLEVLRVNDSIALYVDRARSARPDFALTASNATVIAALCRRLEGMPLAIEMAAAWVKTIPPAKMLERLSQQLDMLVSRRRDLPPRHQSLRATIEWSYNLLNASLQDAFARLGVFRGGWTLEAAEAVCGDNILPMLMELQEHSLIVLMEAEAALSAEGETEDANGEEAEPRYRMLEPLREFAWEKLTQKSRSETAQAAHAAYFAQMADEAYKHYGDAQLAQWLKKLDAERDNLRAVFGWSLTRDCLKALRLVSALAPYWHIRGLVAEGYQLAQQALAHPDAAAPTEERGAALGGMARLLTVQGDLRRAQTYAEEAMQIWRLREDKFRIMIVSNQLAIIAYDLGDTQHACSLWNAMLASARAEGWQQAQAAALVNLGEALLDQGQPAQAQPLFEESLVLMREQQDTERTSRVLNMLGKTLLRLGDEAAIAHVEESLRLRLENNDQAGLIETLETIVEVMAARGENERAARLAGGIQALRSQTIGPRPANEEAHFARSMEQVRANLEASAFEAAWKQGEALTRQQTVEEGQRYILLPAHGAGQAVS